eukprot:9218278-Ditylum_brightwellii.AAC.1
METEKQEDEKQETEEGKEAGNQNAREETTFESTEIALDDCSNQSQLKPTYQEGNQEESKSDCTKQVAVTNTSQNDDPCEEELGLEDTSANSTPATKRGTKRKDYPNRGKYPGCPGRPQGSRSQYLNRKPTVENPELNFKVIPSSTRYLRKIRSENPALAS